MKLLKSKKYKLRRKYILHLKSIIPIGDYCRLCKLRKRYGRYTDYMIIGDKYIKVKLYDIKCIPFNIRGRKDITFGEGVKSCGFNTEEEQ